MAQLVIGCNGEAGRALTEVLEREYGSAIHGLDLDVKPVGLRFGIIHCCLPYNASFDGALYTYIDQYAIPGALIIIHSTVPVGTSEQYGAVHSPIRGVHPNLVDGIRTFTKYFGGPRAADAAKIFKPICKTKTTPLQATTEALKLWDTTLHTWTH